MREALFIKQNAEKWQSYEQMQTPGPDELARRFINLTDDLAYAKTFYPQSKTTAYLNGLTARFHQSIYKNKKEKSGRFAKFWKLELPLLFKKYEKQLLYAFLFFLVFALMGALSAKYDNHFLRLILGDSYVNMTEANIAKGDPFGVYKHQNPFLMFFMIAANNIFVTFRCFAGGVFFTLGSLYDLMKTGLMLGSFEYFFFSKGLGMQSVLVIWIHGTLEISAIIIGGAAGLVLGGSILFPKTFTRTESFKQGAKDGTKMVIGLVPIFLAAAFFESFVTRHTEMPVWLSVAILFLSLVFIVFYVIVYPNYLHQKINLKPHANQN